MPRKEASSLLMLCYALVPNMGEGDVWKVSPYIKSIPKLCGCHLWMLQCSVGYPDSLLIWLFLAATGTQLNTLKNPHKNCHENHHEPKFEKETCTNFLLHEIFSISFWELFCDNFRYNFREHFREDFKVYLIESQKISQPPRSPSCIANRISYWSETVEEMHSDDCQP